MKKIISKIRNKKLKGNISLLVILILLSGSVIALLSINQIQHLLTYGNMTFNYFRAFYIAKAGTQLGLTEVYNSGDGFYHHIEGATKNDDDIITSKIMELNFAGKNGEYAGFYPYFTMDIESKFKILTNDVRDNDNCNDENKIILKPGDGIMLSLFSDDTGSEGFDKILSDEQNKKTFTRLSTIGDLSFEDLNGGSNLTFALFTYNKNTSGEEYMEDIVVQNGGDLSTFLSKGDVRDIINKSITKTYLTIKNSGSNDSSFCIKGKDLIPYSNYLITVRGHYADMEVGLQSVVKKDVPSWSLNVRGEETTSE